MLVLSRAEGERIYLTDKAGIVVGIVCPVTCKDGNVRIGIEVPDEVSIHRDDYVLKDASVGEQLILRTRGKAKHG